jgi:NAD(P)-dependent dehydrogenase (short-subunit alcohol dehydrogenase family)
MPAPTALVLGGTAGIGLAIGRALVERGWQVFAMARGRRDLAEADHAIRFLPADLAEGVAVRRAIETMRQEGGRLDALVCAAAHAPAGPFDAVTDETMLRAFRINVQGPAMAIREALPSLRATRGSVLLIGSTLADHPRPGTAVYSATKGALDSLTRALAVELGPSGVRVNCLRPSMVRTELMVRAGMDPKAYASLLEQRAQSYPLRRVGEVSDLVGMALLLLSPESAWTTGALIDVDGGHSAAGS